ncbi:hypothetical protein GPL21_33125 [Bradyrhizobium pachyrhizi]|uniref:Uncharacterized protein n=1 Tax=Bradyrhizobium pachyrhizi TaxID=280333 RepID=A0A844T327_9BRAD|nr:hypothetical protein [Bradyrhizobium pachyrhizi]MVT69932.1 hypothetical protein [Bradyrhizobium pachyrhizi]
MRVSDTTLRVGFPELQHHWSTAEGNYHAPWRDHWRESGTYLKEYVPPPDAQSREIDEHVGSAILYVVPDSRVTSSVKRLYSSLLARSAPYPKRGEIEFSSPWGSSLPGNYKSSSIQWALSISEAALVCVDRQPGLPEGEAHRVLAPRQCVFRCDEKDVAAWVDYLKPRLFKRHAFAVVHLAAGAA